MKAGKIEIFLHHKKKEMRNTYNFIRFFALMEALNEFSAELQKSKFRLIKFWMNFSVFLEKYFKKMFST